MSSARRRVPLTNCARFIMRILAILVILSASAPLGLSIRHAQVHRAPNEVSPVCGVAVPFYATFEKGAEYGRGVRTVLVVEACV